MERPGTRSFCNPARSPDINPIENLFNQVGRKLTQHALQHQITDQSFEQFPERVILL